MNPGRHGKALADYLAAGLKTHGVQIASVSAEDWGWRVDVNNAHFPLWIGCGNVDGEQDRFLCFVEPSKPSAGWFMRTDTRPATERLSNELYAVLAANPNVEGLVWTD